jgi:recombination protein RecT
MSQTPANQPSGAVAIVDKFKTVVNGDKMQENLERALGNNKDAFAASMIELFSNDKNLQKCDPRKVAMEAFKAATLKLPLSKSLGFAYVVPYKNEPTFIIGYKGLIQLAQRTGQYEYINADAVFEGELVGFDKLTGAVDVTGKKLSEKIIGYFAYIETVNGFKKALYWSKEKVLEHAQKYSPSFGSSYSPWQKQFDDMAIKTVLRQLISKYGIMTTEFATALDSDKDETSPYSEAEQKANSEVVDFEEAEFEEVNEETGEVTQQGDATQEPPKEQQKADPGF